MNEISFEARVKATGLRPKADDLADLEALVRDLDRAAAQLRGPRSYAEEPLCAFKLQQAGPETRWTERAEVKQDVAQIERN
nr:hypothetical protein [uncultured Rhodopila sp.]